MQTAALALLGIASLLVGFILILVLPGLPVYAWAIMAIGALLLAAAVVLDFRRIRGALASRRGAFGLGTTVKVALFAGIVILANAISVGTYHRFDFTSLAQLTLTSQTKEVLARLDAPVEAVGVFSSGASADVSGYARSLLAEYRNNCGRLTVREIDPDISPDEARRYQVDQYGAQNGVVVFVGSHGRRMVYASQISEGAEHAFTSAILEVSGARQKKVYFLGGHGEAGIAGDFAAAAGGLRDNLFQVEELDLLAAGGVPGDAALIVVAAPRRQPADGELALLTAYARKGGRMFLLLDAGAPQGFRRLLASWGVELADGTIIEPAEHASPNKDAPLVSRTRNYFGFAQVYFPGASALLPLKETPPNLAVMPIAWTSPEGWLERDFVSGRDPTFDEKRDRKGPLAMGVLISPVTAEGGQETNGMRMAVIADSDFAANPHFPDGNNADLFLTTVNWLAEGTEIISVDRRVLPVRRLILAPEEARFLTFSSVGLLPLLLLVVAGILAWRRR